MADTSLAVRAVGAPAGEAGRATGRALRILLAEDQPFLRDMLARYLRAMGHTVCEAPDGAEAWRLFQEKPFDLVVTDQLMPHLTGTELSRRVKAAAAGTPVILITGYMEALPAEETRGELIDVLITKPFPPSTLGRTIEHLTRR